MIVHVQDPDMVVVEFSFNDPFPVPFQSGACCVVDVGRTAGKGFMKSSPFHACFVLDLAPLAAVLFVAQSPTTVHLRLVFACRPQQHVPASFPPCPCTAVHAAPRKGFEQLLRKLLRLPSRPLVVLLHHYPWWYAVEGGRPGIFWQGGEMELDQFAQVPKRIGGWGAEIQGDLGVSFWDSMTSCEHY
jgi:hypothetical protein